MSSQDSRGLISPIAEDTYTWQKSPFVQGFLAGIKGALMGAGGGTLINAARGANPVAGAIIGGLGAGLLTGISKAVSVDVDDISTEAAQRFHAMRLKSREPFIYMPPPANFAQLFSKYHDFEHRSKSISPVKV